MKDSIGHQRLIGLQITKNKKTAANQKYLKNFHLATRQICGVHGREVDGMKGSRS